MQLETFQGQNMAEVITRTRRTLGEDAMIVRTHVDQTEEGPLIEIVAAKAEDIEALRAQLEAGEIPIRSGGDRIRPFTIALVGPPGAGKTTTAMKLALHPRALGDRKVGLITLDTYRVGAMDELATYAEIAGIPLEIVFNERDMDAALGRLSGRDAVIVDTPGRVGGASPEAGEWPLLVRRLQPDEIHMVLPAGFRADVAEALAAEYSSIAPTHLLLTKADQLPGDDGLASIPQKVGLPIRWLANGQAIPGGLALAGPRVLGALGAQREDDTWERMVG